MLLLNLLPILAVLLTGGVLWARLLMRPRLFEEWGLGPSAMTVPRSVLVAALVVLSYLPIKIAAVLLLGVDEESGPVLMMQANVAGNVVTAALFVLALVAVRVTTHAECPICGSPAAGLECAVCGTTAPPAPPASSQPEAFGLVWHPLKSLYFGFLGLFLAYPLVILANLAAAPFRTIDKLHPFLKSLLTDRNDELVTWVFLSAAVAAPIAEEIVFRGCLQGWLRNRLQPGMAIGFTSVVFAAIHGWPDMIGILPLAIILGVIYERTNDLLAVIVTHASFNGLMTWNMLAFDPEEYERALEELEQAREALEAGVLSFLV